MRYFFLKRTAAAALLLAALLMPAHGNAAITLEECLDKARENYPLVAKYGLVEHTARIELSDINKSWLPRVGVYAQATAQNKVPGLPEALHNVLAQMGQESRGIGLVQYKAGVDVTQTVWDGGASRAQRAVERARTHESQAALEVEMYAVRERVMNLFFGVLLLDEQIARTENTVTLLRASRTLMESMLKGGVAMQSDVDMLEAQELSMLQQVTSARNAAKGYRDMLSLYVGENLDGEELVRPHAEMPADLESRRPELELFRARNLVSDARDAAVASSVMPKIGLFAQAYYGYPGFNYFDSMINRNLSFNVLAGVKVSWSIDAFYTRGNSRRRLALAAESTDADREVFLFNNRLQATSQVDAIEGLRAVMADDNRIVELRTSVRRAAESQLANGVIDATALLAKITDENQARLTASYHEIELLQAIFQLKNTLNR